MDESRITFKSADGTTLVGLVAKPTGTPRGAVVLAHGITVEKNEGGFYTRLAAHLAQRNLSSLRFDFRGHGDSQGKSDQMTIRGEIDDLSAAVDTLASGNSAVSIVGTSFGAAIAIEYAHRHAEKVLSLSLLAPVLDFRRTFLQPETEWAEEWFTKKALQKAEKTGQLNLDGFVLGKALLSEFAVLKPIDSLRSISTPTLIVHGSDDSMVPFPVARDASKGLPHVTFIAVEEADHGFEGFEDGVFDEVAKWILRHPPA